MSTEFDKLLAELAEAETIAKALPAGGANEDENVRAAAGANADDPAVAGAGGEGEDNEEEGEEDELMGKSFGVTLADGTQAEAYDGTAILKSFQDRMDQMEGALGQAVAVMKSLASGIATRDAKVAKQDTIIKSLTADLAKVGGQGAGRRTTINVHDKVPAGTPVGAANPLAPQEIMAKALSAQASGRMSAIEVSALENYLGKGMSPPDYLLKALG